MTDEYNVHCMSNEYVLVTIYVYLIILLVHGSACINIPDNSILQQ